MSATGRARILVVDDSASVREDFRKILEDPHDAGPELDRADARLFGREPTSDRSPRPGLGFEVQGAPGGVEALAALRAARSSGRPFAVAFVDVRMPGGWDGVRTTQALWGEDAGLQVVLCTAFRARTWDDVQLRLGPSDRLLLLDKPFDRLAVLQLATALAHRSALEQRALREKEELERLVVERTAELSAANRALVDQMVELRSAEARAREAVEHLSEAHEELEEAHARASAATLARSEFLANTSHEIRTPMTAVLGYADLLRDPSLSHEQRLEHLDVIQRCGRHLLALMSDVLDLAALESGRMAVDRRTTSPAAVLAEVGSLMRPRAAEKGLEFELTAQGPVPATIRTDPALLRQVLVHLVSNAIKFTTRGSVRVRIGLLASDEGRRRQLRFAVEDTGMGMSTAQLDRLFQPFEQGDGSTVRRFAGTGLGLAIAHRLAHRLGGDVQAESVLGSGSLFALTVATGALEGVPLLTDLREALEAEQPAPECGDVAAAETSSLAGLRILLAEDGRENQLLLSFHLRKAGAEVVVASDGMRALRLALEAVAGGAPHDVIVTDMQMPGLDGYDLARRLRDHGYRAPILALTAHALLGDRERCLAAGCDEYLSKPAERGALVAACARLAARWRSTWTRPAEPAPPAALPSCQRDTAGSASGRKRGDESPR